MPQAVPRCERTPSYSSPLPASALHEEVSSRGDTFGAPIAVLRGTDRAQGRFESEERVAYCFRAWRRLVRNLQNFFICQFVSCNCIATTTNPNNHACSSHAADDECWTCASFAWQLHCGAASREQRAESTSSSTPLKRFATRLGRQWRTRRKPDSATTSFSTRQPSTSKLSGGGLIVVAPSRYARDDV